MDRYGIKIPCCDCKEKDNCGLSSIIIPNLKEIRNKNLDRKELLGLLLLKCYDPIKEGEDDE